MPTKDKRYIYIITLAIVMILIDQFSKMIIINSIPLHGSVTVIDGFFNLVNIRNLGAAFGVLNNPEISWQFWLFLAATVVATAIIYNLTRTSHKDWLLFTGFGLILGGAYGNLIDRIRYRAVIDFLDFYVNNIHWPAFNVADICICIGALLTAVSIFKPQKK